MYFCTMYDLALPFGNRTCEITSFIWSKSRATIIPNPRFVFSPGFTIHRFRCFLDFCFINASFSGNPTLVSSLSFYRLE